MRKRVAKKIIRQTLQGSCRYKRRTRLAAFNRLRQDNRFWRREDDFLPEPLRKALNTLAGLLNQSDEELAA